MKSFVFCIFVWGIMGKYELFSFLLKIILLWHKVGLCLHGHIYVKRMYYARTFKMNYVIAIYMYVHVLHCEEC